MLCTSLSGAAGLLYFQRAVHAPNQYNVDGTRMPAYFVSLSE